MKWEDNHQKIIIFKNMRRELLNIKIDLLFLDNKLIDWIWLLRKYQINWKYHKEEIKSIKLNMIP